MKCVQVLEEREKLKKDRDNRAKRKGYLLKELERLRKQQGTHTHPLSCLLFVSLHHSLSFLL